MGQKLTKRAFFVDVYLAAIGLTNQSYTVAATGGAFAGDTISTSSRSIQLVTAGLNYKFGWGGGGGWW
jgi:hypothetical protein